MADTPHMADPPRYPDTDGGTDAGADRGSTTGPPRWVSVLGVVVVIVVVMLIIILHLTGTIGPGLHS